MTTLIATKPMRYQTRRLKAGDSFDVPRKYAEFFVRRKGARYPQAGDDEDLTVLRREYKQVVGTKAYHGWSAAELRAKIHAAAVQQDAPPDEDEW